MKVLCFGAGKYYSNRKERIRSKATIVGILDNNRALWSKTIEGIKIYDPNTITALDYDYIILTSAHAFAMREQLVKLGVNDNKVLYYEDFLFLVRGSIQVIGELGGGTRKKIAVLLQYIDNDGSTAAAFNAAKALKKYYADIIVAAGEIHNRGVDELTNDGIKVVIDAGLFCPDQAKLEWLHGIDECIVNNARMVRVVSFFSHKGAVFWWIHDPCDVVIAELKKNESYFQQIDWERVQAVAVSNRVKKECNHIFKKEMKICPYGFEEYQKKWCKRMKKTIFATIGMVYYLKGQDILIDAIALLPEQILEKVEFWIVGRYDKENTFDNRIVEFSKNYLNVKLVGEISQEEIREVYAAIDVLAAPSRNDMLPVSVVEGLYNRKTCIMSDATGTAEYISNGNDGFVFESGNYKALARIIEKIAIGRYELDVIGNAGYEIFKKNFSMEQFAERYTQIVGR